MANFSYSVKIFPFQSSGKAKAFASIIIDDVFEIRGFRVMEGNKGGYWVAAPSTKGKDKTTGEDKWYEDVSFHEETNREEGIYQGPVQKELYDSIIKAYESHSQGQSRGNTANARKDAVVTKPKYPDIADKVW